MSGRTDWGVPSSTLTLPPFAGDNDNAIVIGPDIPASLLSWFASSSFAAWVPVAAIIYRYDANNYAYDCLAVRTGVFSGIIRAQGVISTQYSYIYAYTDLPFYVGGAPSYSIANNSVPALILGVPGSFPNHSGIKINNGTSPALIEQHGEQFEINYYNTGYFRILRDVVERFRMDNTAANWKNIDPQYNGTSLPRGILGYAQSTSATGAIGTGGTVALSVVASVENARALKITVGGSYSTSLSTNKFEYHLDRGGVTFAGQPGFNPQVGTVPIGFTYSHIVVNNSGALASQTFSVYVLCDAGTVNWLATAQLPRYILIEDIGPSSLATGAPQI